MALIYRMDIKTVRLNKWVPFFVVLIGLLPWSDAYCEPLEPSHSLVSSIKISKPLKFCGERVPLKVQEVRERMEKELLLAIWDRPQVILWLKRSRRYLPIIEKMLTENNLPDDLKYVAVAESALRPHVGSGKGAIGFWQFLAQTGRRFGLIINPRIDQRRNIFASTGAAIRCLKAFHDIFGSWTLAVAAYNMGEEGLMAEILEQGTKNYYRLYLPLETQRFIFRILSVKLILSDPDKYGIRLGEDDYYPPLLFDQIEIECFQETPIRIIAQAAKTHFKVIKDLNPEIRGHYLTAGIHKILIPKGAAADFQARYPRLIKKHLKVQKERIYVVQNGDNLSLIAERFDIPLAALIIWNRIDLKRPIHPGEHLVIYPKSIRPD